MGKKRKRPLRDDNAVEHQPHPPQKLRSPKAVSSCPRRPSSDRGGFHHPHPVISLYYKNVLTLRQYLLQQLPLSSKSRRRRIGSLGLQQGRHCSAQHHSGDADQNTQTVRDIASLLDSTLVGVLKESNPTVSQARYREFAAFTQSQGRSSLVCTDTGPTRAQSEVKLEHGFRFYSVQCCNM